MDNYLFECEIPGRPGILKNGKRLVRAKGRVIQISSKKYQEFERFAGLFISRNKKHLTITLPVQANVDFYLKNHQHEFDTTNGCEGIFDILQKCEVIIDDKLIYKVVAQKHFIENVEEKIFIKVKLL